MEASGFARVMFLGKRKVHTDRLYNTNAVWEGKGDVQLVPVRQAILMAQYHPDTYALVETGTEEPAYVPPDMVEQASVLADLTIPDTNGEMVPVSAASWKALQSYCHSIGLVVTPQHDKEQMISAISNHRAKISEFHSAAVATPGELAAEEGAPDADSVSVPVPPPASPPLSGLEPIESMVARHRVEADPEFRDSLPE